MVKRVGKKCQSMAQNVGMLRTKAGIWNMKNMYRRDNWYSWMNKITHRIRYIDIKDGINKKNT